LGRMGDRPPKAKGAPDRAASGGGLEGAWAGNGPAPRVLLFQRLAKPAISSASGPRPASSIAWGAIRHGQAPCSSSRGYAVVGNCQKAMNMQQIRPQAAQTEAARRRSPSTGKLGRQRNTTPRRTFRCCRASTAEPTEHIRPPLEAIPSGCGRDAGFETGSEGRCQGEIHSLCRSISKPPQRTSTPSAGCPCPTIHARSISRKATAANATTAAAPTWVARCQHGLGCRFQASLVDSDRTPPSDRNRANEHRGCRCRDRHPLGETQTDRRGLPAPGCRSTPLPQPAVVAHHQGQGTFPRSLVLIGHQKRPSCARNQPQQAHWRQGVPGRSEGQAAVCRPGARGPGGQRGSPRRVHQLGGGSGEVLHGAGGKRGGPLLAFQVIITEMSELAGPFKWGQTRKARVRSDCPIPPLTRFSDGPDRRLESGGKRQNLKAAFPPFQTHRFSWQARRQRQKGSPARNWDSHGPGTNALFQPHQQRIPGA